MYDKLVQLVKSLGFKLEHTSLAQDVNGETSWSDESVRISNEVEPAQQLKTLVHELGHILLHPPEQQNDRYKKEIEAESVAFVVCNAIGLDTSSYSHGYVLSWAQSPDIASEVLKDSAERISKAAQVVLTWLEKKDSVKEVAVA